MISLPIWSCSVWGLPSRRHYCRRGGLLPHRFTLTAESNMSLCLSTQAQTSEAVCFLLHWPSSSFETGIPDVIRHTALRSSDFPPPGLRLAAIIRPPALGSSVLGTAEGYPPPPYFAKYAVLFTLACDFSPNMTFEKTYMQI